MVTAGGRPPLPGACRAAGTGRRAAGPFLPGRARSAPQSPRSPQPGPARGRAAENQPLRRRSGCLRAQRCPTPHRRLHLRRLSGTRREGTERHGPDKVTHWESAAVRGAHRLPAPQPSASSALRGPLREPGARRPPLGRESLPPPPPLQISWQEANSGQDFTSQPPLLPSPGASASRPTRQAPGPIGGRIGRERAGQRADPPIRGLRGRVRPGPSLPG